MTVCRGAGEDSLIATFCRLVSCWVYHSLPAGSCQWAGRGTYSGYQWVTCDGEGCAAENARTRNGYTKPLYSGIMDRVGYAARINPAKSMRKSAALLSYCYFPSITSTTVSARSHWRSVDSALSRSGKEVGMGGYLGAPCPRSRPECNRLERVPPYGFTPCLSPATIRVWSAAI